MSSTQVLEVLGYVQLALTSFCVGTNIVAHATSSVMGTRRLTWIQAIGIVGAGYGVGLLAFSIPVSNWFMGITSLGTVGIGASPAYPPQTIGVGLLVLQVLIASLFLVASFFRVSISAMATVLVGLLATALLGSFEIVQPVQIGISAALSLIAGPVIAVAATYGLMRCHQRAIHENPDPLAVCLRTASYIYTPIIPFHLGCLFMLASHTLMPGSPLWLPPIIAFGIFVGTLVILAPAFIYLVIPRLKLISYKKFRQEHSDYLPEKNESYKAERQAMEMRGMVVSSAPVTGGRHSMGSGGSDASSAEGPGGHHVIGSNVNISQLRSEEFFVPLHLILAILMAIYDGALVGGALLSLHLPIQQHFHPMAKVAIPQTTVSSVFDSLASATTAAAANVPPYWIVVIVAVATMSGGYFGRRVGMALGTDLLHRLTPSRAAIIDGSTLLLPSLSLAFGIPISLGLCKAAAVVAAAYLEPSAHPVVSTNRGPSVVSTNSNSSGKPGSGGAEANASNKSILMFMSAGWAISIFGFGLLAAAILFGTFTLMSKL